MLARIVSRSLLKKKKVLLIFPGQSQNDSKVGALLMDVIRFTSFYLIGDYMYVFALVKTTKPQIICKIPVPLAGMTSVSRSFL